MATFLLALDQATTNTGFAVFKGQELIAHGTKTFTGDNHIIRIYKLCQWVESIILSIDKDLEVVIEDIQLQDMGAKETVGIPTFKKLAHVQGALLTLFEQYGIKSQVVTPNQWRSTCGIAVGRGKNRAMQKAAARQYVKQTFGIEVEEDAADAICIGQHVISTKDSEVNWT